jgi:hypothetical protein
VPNHKRRLRRHGELNVRKLIHGEEHPYNTDAESYAPNLSAAIAKLNIDDATPSKRVVRALQAVRPGVRTSGFKKEVLNAILDDACEEVTKEWRVKYLRRLKRWTGPRYIEHFYERFEILASWKQRYPVVPDAYLIDAAQKTVVCFEIEDHHHLNPLKVEHYGGAWWCLEYIFWDLHLISYDIYGNPRIIELPESELAAKHLLDDREAKKKTADTTGDD